VRANLIGRRPDGDWQGPKAAVTMCQTAVDADTGLNRPHEVTSGPNEPAAINPMARQQKDTLGRF